LGENATAYVSDGVLTRTVAERFWLPLGPLQVIVYVFVPSDVGVIASLPATASGPLHAPLAVHSVRFGDLQDSVKGSPTNTWSGRAEMSTAAIAPASPNAARASALDSSPIAAAGAQDRRASI
jgi:hypothetical protein